MGVQGFTAQGKEDITELFVDQGFNLYNYVSYNAEDMDVSEMSLIFW